MAEKAGKKLEKRVADLYRDMGAWKVQHDVELAGNQIDVYVELATPAHMVHRVAVEAKDWKSTVDIHVVNDFDKVASALRRANLIDEGVIVSAVGFSRQARNAAREHRITLREPADLEQMVAEARQAGRARPTTPPIPKLPMPFFAHPYPLQANFTGRVREREMLTEWLINDNRPVFALIAIGGMGKSPLTWAWIKRDVLGLRLIGQPDDPPDVVKRCRVPDAARPEGVLWWSFYESQASFGSFVRTAVAYASGGEVDPASIPSLYDGCQALLTVLQRKRILLVLDGLERILNAYTRLDASYQGDDVKEDPEQKFRACTDPNATAFLQALCAAPHASRVLITSRLLPRELDEIAEARPEELTGLDPEDAVAFLRVQGVTKGNRPELLSAGQPYQNHPLALRLLAGVVAKDPRTPGDIQAATRRRVLPDLRGRKHHHILELSYEALDGGDRGLRRVLVRARRWIPTFIQRRLFKTRTLLSNLAAFRSSMDFEAIQAISPFADEAATGEALQELVGRGLLQRSQDAPPQFDLHPIVRQYAYDRLAHKKGVHTHLHDYFDAVPKPDGFTVKSLDDLQPAMELYHHTIRAGRLYEAMELYRDRLSQPLYYRFGAYLTCIELLSSLFPDGQPFTPTGEAALPRLEDQAAQAWTLNSLANSYALSGQPRRAVTLYDQGRALHEEPEGWGGLAMTLGNVANRNMEFGSLAVAEKNLRRGIALCREIKDEFNEAVGHQELGRLLGYRGEGEGAQKELAAALAAFEKANAVEWQGITWAFRALRALLLGDGRGAVEAARRARQLADESAVAGHPNPGDVIRAEWLLGWAKVALAAEDEEQKGNLLAEAGGHLTEALTRCRWINLVELEPDILLAWGRWHRVKGNGEEAKKHADEALTIADRCEYRLCQADIHNFLAQLALDAGDKPMALRHAQIGRERAECDGKPHWYKPAVDEAERLLREAGRG